MKIEIVQDLLGYKIEPDVLNTFSLTRVWKMNSNFYKKCMSPLALLLPETLQFLMNTSSNFTRKELQISSIIKFHEPSWTSEIMLDIKDALSTQSCMRMG